MTELNLIGIPQSTYVRVICMLCAEKGVDYTLDPQMPHSEKVSAIHPYGKVPVMRHGDMELAESEAIARYIDRVFDGPTLFPSDPVAAGAVDQWVSMFNTHMDELLVRKYLFAYVFSQTEDGSPDRALIDATQDDMRQMLTVLDAAVARNGYLATGELTFADLNLYPALFYLSNMPESGAAMKSLPALNGYFETLSARPSAQSTVPPEPGN